MSDSSSDESSRSPSPVPSLGSRKQHSRPTQDRPTTESHQPASPQAPASPTKQSTKANSDVSQTESQTRPPPAQLQPQPQRKASRSRHRGRSHTRRSPSVAGTISDAGAEEVLPNSDKRRKRKNKKRQQHPLPVVNEVESTGREVVESAGNAVQSVGDTAGTVTEAAKPSEGGSDKPLKLRLDLNLDADIRLTAKIHGDITLSLL